MSNFHLTIEERYPELYKGFKNVIKKAKLQDQVDIKAIHFGPMDLHGDNCHTVHVCKNINGTTVCTSKTICT
jgi:hypothetical protein